MLLAILTDVHSNREALTACLEDAQARRATHYAFLGDLVGYGADPAWVLDTVMDHAQRGAHVVLGNHDAGVLPETVLNLNPGAREAVEWTRSQLTPAHIDFIRALPYRIEQDDLLLVHANAWGPERWEYVEGTLEAARSIMATRARVTFCGHVHSPALYHLSATGKTGSFEPASAESIPLGAQRRWLVIPGAVGQPRDGNPAACYATYDTATRALTFLRVPYDAATAARKIMAAGLPPKLAERLLTGD